MAKRSNGEGMIRQRSDGRWESRLMVGCKDNGKPEYKSVYGKTKKEAREKMKQFLNHRADVWFERRQDKFAWAFSACPSSSTEERTK